MFNRISLWSTHYPRSLTKPNQQVFYSTDLSAFLMPNKHAKAVNETSFVSYKVLYQEHTKYQISKYQ